MVCRRERGRSRSPLEHARAQASPAPRSIREQEEDAELRAKMEKLHKDVQVHGLAPCCSK